MTNKEILELKFNCRDLNQEITVKEWLKEILITFIREGEEFSGKYPLGNSDWDYDVLKLFIENHIIFGGVDQYGDLFEYDWSEFSNKMIELIKEL